MTSALTDAGRADWAENGTSGQTLRMLLVTAEPSGVAATATVADIADEATMDGYTREDLPNVVVTNDSTNHQAILSCDTITFSDVGASTGKVYGAWIFRQVGASPDDESDIPWGYLDTNNIATNGSDLTLTPGSSGLLTLS